MLIRPSHLLTQARYISMQHGARVLEQDERGPKVFLLPDQTILKVFRPRSRWSRDTLYSNSRSFCRNAERLSVKGIPTISILGLYHLENTSDTAVLYTPLPGITMRDLLKQDAFTPEICHKLGAFIAELHHKGIYFRSLHFGNFLYTDSNSFGLIDIADMNIYWWPLYVSTRIRNFRRIQKYHEDMLNLGQQKRLSIIDAYVEHAALSRRQAERLLNNIRYQPHLDAIEA